MTSKGNLATGIEIVTKAVEHDTAKRYKEAIYLYQLSVDFFNRSLQEEENASKTTVITSKIHEYENRIMDLRHLMLKERFAGMTQHSSSAPDLTQKNNNTIGSLSSSAPIPVTDGHVHLSPSSSPSASRPTAALSPTNSPRGTGPTIQRASTTASVRPGAPTTNNRPSTTSPSLQASPSTNRGPTAVPSLQIGSLANNRPSTTSASPQVPSLAMNRGSTTPPVQASPPLARPASSLHIPPLSKAFSSPSAMESPRGETKEKEKDTILHRGLSSLLRIRGSSKSHQDSTDSEFSVAQECIRQAELQQDLKEKLNLYKLATEHLMNAYQNLQAQDPKSKKAQKSSEKDEEASPVLSPRAHREPTKTHSVDFQRNEVLFHERLGGGGSGATVIRCSVNGFSFAGKLLQGDTVEETIAAIKNEITIMESLDNPHIVRYLGHDLSKPGEIRLYMEYCPKTLNDIIIQRKQLNNPFSVTEVCNFMLQIAKGLNYLHTLDPPIVHRDLKSENIFLSLDPQGNVQALKIGDFDTSKVLEASSKTYTKHTGTTGFQAPEIVALESKGHSQRADIYSYGMVLYELMMLEKPFFDVHPTKRWEMTAKAIKPTLSPEVEAKYKQIIPIWKKCLSKNPSKRPTALKLKQTFAELT